jgi:hypothetical protein
VVGAQAEGVRCWEVVVNICCVVVDSRVHSIRQEQDAPYAAALLHVWTPAQNLAQFQSTQQHNKNNMSLAFVIIY